MFPRRCRRRLRGCLPADRHSQLGGHLRHRHINRRDSHQDNRPVYRLILQVGLLHSRRVNLVPNLARNLRAGPPHNLAADRQVCHLDSLQLSRLVSQLSRLGSHQRNPRVRLLDSHQLSRHHIRRVSQVASPRSQQDSPPASPVVCRLASPPASPQGSPLWYPRGPQRRCPLPVHRHISPRPRRRKLLTPASPPDPGAPIRLLCTPQAPLLGT